MNRSNTHHIESIADTFGRTLFGDAFGRSLLGDACETKESTSDGMFCLCYTRVVSKTNNKRPK